MLYKSVKYNFLDVLADVSLLVDAYSVFFQNKGTATVTINGFVLNPNEGLKLSPNHAKVKQNYTIVFALTGIKKLSVITELDI